MATAIVMPKLGNTVESSIIVNWLKQEGDPIAEGDVLCEVETDKATLEVESTAAGTLLARFFDVGDEVPVMVNIAAVGEPGEEVDPLRPDVMTEAEAPPAGADGNGKAPISSKEAKEAKEAKAPDASDVSDKASFVRISPRARGLADQKGMDIAGLEGTGPMGRIIERDIRAALTQRPRLTPVARAMVESGEFVAPEAGTGPGGRVTKRDLRPAAQAPTAEPDAVEVIPVRGVRKVIAERMFDSVHSTAQLTLNASADARALLEYRKRLKASDESLGLQRVTINDLVLFAVSRTLTQYPEMNALFEGDTITRHRRVQLAFAVDTPRGLIVPVIRGADRLSLKQTAAESKRLTAACQEGSVLPDELEGGTFTVTNLGALGIESFTPILNPPQVGILGVGNINLKPIQAEGEVAFVPHLGLSLTINHQGVDGAPAARFLQALSRNLAEIDLLLAL